MERLVWKDLDAAAREAALARPAARRDPALAATVRAIVEDVRDGGWNALVRQAERIDGAPPRRVPVDAIARDALRELSVDQRRALGLAARNIRAFHAAALPADLAVETAPGLTVRKIWRPLGRIGLYVPGGATPLFSSLLMLAIPARMAGVGEIVAVTPPRTDGGLDPLVALAARIAGIEAVWTVGGAQAVAALAFGAGPIPRVAKICGPGNAFVAEAKRHVSALPGGPAIDMPAGPSELMVIADAGADPAMVAADLLGQAEHDPSAQVLLVTNAPVLADAVAAAVSERIATLPRRAIAEASLKAARAILVDTLDEAVAVANLYAPEHLSLAVARPDALLPAVRDCGAVFAGRLAAETFGDYLAGSSHVLPTDGAARAWSGISTQSFMKAISVQSVTAEAARRIARPAATLARMEGLEAHARAADLRAAAA